MFNFHDKVPATCLCLWLIDWLTDGWSYCLNDGCIVSSWRAALECLYRNRQSGFRFDFDIANLTTFQLILATFKLSSAAFFSQNQRLTVVWSCYFSSILTRLRFYWSCLLAQECIILNVANELKCLDTPALSVWLSERPFLCSVASFTMMESSSDPQQRSRAEVLFLAKKGRGKSGFPCDSLPPSQKQRGGVAPPQSTAPRANLLQDVSGTIKDLLQIIAATQLSTEDNLPGAFGAEQWLAACLR